MAGAVGIVFGLCVLSFTLGAALMYVLVRRREEAEPAPSAADAPAEPTWVEKPAVVESVDDDYDTRPIHRNPVVGLRHLEPALAALAEPVSGPMLKPISTPVSASGAGPVSGAVPGPVAEAGPGVGAAVGPDLVAEVGAEPVAVSEPELVAKAEPRLVAKVGPEPVAEAGPEPVAEPRPAPLAAETAEPHAAVAGAAEPHAAKPQDVAAGAAEQEAAEQSETVGAARYDRDGDLEPSSGDREAPEPTVAVGTDTPAALLPPAEPQPAERTTWVEREDFRRRYLRTFEEARRKAGTN